MDSFDHQSWLANDDDGDDNDLANSLRHVEMIDFFAIERETVPAKQPWPDHQDAGFEMFTVNTASTTSPPAAVLYDGDEEEKGEMAAVQAVLQRINEDNQRLRSMIGQMYALLKHARRSSSSSSSSSSTPPPDAHDVPWPPLLEPRRAPNNDVPESSNAAAMRGRGEVGPVDDSGSPKKRKVKASMVLDEPASNVSEDTIEDDDQHHDDRNSNKKLKSSPPPPEKEEKAAAMRKARVIVRFRTETDDINGIVKIDGCQWRKYGQKIPKGSPNTPRCYYRCSMANQCPMRKHLQKCTDEESIVEATYQDAHNHPLPQEAVPMARAAAAALKMVMSGSMPYGEALMDTSALAATMPPGTWAPRTATVSTMSPFPTAQLDLSKSPDPTRFQGQPPAAQLPAAFPDGAVPAHLLQKSAELLAAAFAHVLRGSGGGNGGAH